MIKKVLIANRGEIAVRIIRTCREMGIKTVAVYSDVDQSLPHVWLADEAYPLHGTKSTETYLRINRIIEIARKSKADAIHPGYGFLAENPEFSESVVQAGLIFIGPTAKSIALMGDKTAARQLMQSSGVPIIPGTEEPLENVGQALQTARQLGFPVLLKAAAGGGGKGMRVVENPDELESAFNRAHSEALSAFGDGRIYLEKYLRKPRHIEFQILADSHGNCVHLGERECSIQRRYQKIIEESPSLIIDDTLRSQMGQAAVQAARAVNYLGAGTIEFLVDADRNFYFLEMNTRIQVEHPITEMRTGVDLVKEQIRIASGLPLSEHSLKPTFTGYALECRVYAEDIWNNFVPDSGELVEFLPPSGAGVRFDGGFSAGNLITPYYDPMIGKLITYGLSREEAIKRMLRAIEEFKISGIKTSLPFCAAVLRHPEFTSGQYDTHFISRNMSAILEEMRPSEEIKRVLAAAIGFHLSRVQTIPSLNNHSSRTGLSSWKILGRKEQLS